MIYGAMTGYTVYKTNDAGIVSVNPMEERIPYNPQRSQVPQVRKPVPDNTIQDIYEQRPRQSSEDNFSEKELKSIRRLLEEISAKLTFAPSPQRDYAATTQIDSGSSQKVQPMGEITPPSIRPQLRNDIPAYNQHYGYSFNPQTIYQQGGPYNVLQACKNLNTWAKTEYSQTEGFDTTYSPQELRDRIAILDEIKNHINTVPGYVPPPKEAGSAPITEKNIATYKIMKKDPDRITRRTYFEATV